MPWNAPGNGDRDPWNNNKGGDQGPPDLDEALRKLQEKLGGLFLAPAVPAVIPAKTNSVAAVAPAPASAASAWWPWPRCCG